MNDETDTPPLPGDPWMRSLWEALETVKREVAVQLLLSESGTAATAPEDS